MGSHRPRDEVEAIVGVAEEEVGEETTRRTVVEVVLGGEGPILEVEAEDTFPTVSLFHLDGSDQRTVVEGTLMAARWDVAMRGAMNQ